MSRHHRAARHLLLAAVLATATSALALPLAAQPPTPAGPPTSGPRLPGGINPTPEVGRYVLRIRWEYARYTREVGGDEMEWTSPTQDLSGTFRRVLPRMGFRDMARLRDPEPALFNALGSDGWELVDCHIVPGTPATSGSSGIADPADPAQRVCTFKRTTDNDPRVSTGR